MMGRSISWQRSREQKEEPTEILGLEKNSSPNKNLTGWAQRWQKDETERIKGPARVHYK